MQSPWQRELGDGWGVALVEGVVGEVNHESSVIGK